LATFADTVGIHDGRNVIQEINNEEKINGDCTVARVALAVEEAVSSLPQAVSVRTEDGYIMVNWRETGRKWS
jgi:hypothetical protein